MISNKSKGQVRAWKSRKDYHGMKNTKFYNSYRSMITRCNGTAGKDSIKKYKERGIKVCDRWRGKFKNFYEDMFPTWKEGLTLGRIDNDGDYTPDNCRWETIRQQSLNKRNTRFIEWEGKKLTLLEWSDVLGVGYNSLKLRYYRSYRKGKCSLGDLMTFHLQESYPR